MRWDKMKTSYVHHDGSLPSPWSIAVWGTSIVKARFRSIGAGKLSGERDKEMAWRYWEA
jgi:hypothetical protein